MNKCLNCGELVNNKYCNVSCQNSHQCSARTNKIYGEIKEFKVKCNCCNCDVSIQEREKLFPKKEKYFCSKSCANKRKHSKETKEKIKNTLIVYYDNKIPKINVVKNLNCIVCNNEFISEKKKKFICVICNNDFISDSNKKTCSKECNKSLHKLNGSIGGKKAAFNKKQYNGDMITYIYALTDEIGNIRYIGKSNNVESRYKSHLKESKNKKTHKEKWINSMINRNLKPDYFILEECIFSDWIFMEEYWIAQVKAWGFNLTNGTIGGEGSNGFKGKKHSEETKQKLREKTLYNNKHGLVKPYKINYETNIGIKLTNEDVISVREKYNGDNLRELAIEYSVNFRYLRQIINNKRRIL